MEFLDFVREEYFVRRGLNVRLVPRSTGCSKQNQALEEILQEARFVPNMRVRAYQTILLDLTLDLLTIRKRFDQKWRNQLNGAERSGLQIEMGRDPGFFARFEKLYKEMWAKKRFPTGVRIPIVRQLQRALPESRRFHITIATDGGEDVGATVCAVAGDTMLYYLGATSPTLRKNCRPGYLLQWSQIGAARELGLRWYDTGGVLDDESEVSRFKRRMNGCFVRFPGRWELSHKNRGAGAYGVAEQLYRKLRRVCTGR
jgi:lipid II:glycine glycyltransferase (peptidoglycan interpeptide bridge formation enzyme)